MRRSSTTARRGGRARCSRRPRRSTSRPSGRGDRGVTSASTGSASPTATPPTAPTSRASAHGSASVTRSSARSTCSRCCTTRTGCSLPSARSRATTTACARPSPASATSPASTSRGRRSTDGRSMAIATGPCSPSRACARHRRPAGGRGGRGGRAPGVARRGDRRDRRRWPTVSQRLARAPPRRRRDGLGAPIADLLARVSPAAASTRSCSARRASRARLRPARGGHSGRLRLYRADG